MFSIFKDVVCYFTQTLCIGGLLFHFFIFIKLKYQYIIPMDLCENMRAIQKTNSAINASIFHVTGLDTFRIAHNTQDDPNSQEKVINGEGTDLNPHNKFYSCFSW